MAIEWGLISLWNHIEPSIGLVEECTNNSANQSAPVEVVKGITG